MCTPRVPIPDAYFCSGAKYNIGWELIKLKLSLLPREQGHKQQLPQFGLQDGVLVAELRVPCRSAGNFP